MEDRVGYFRKLFVENMVGTFINLQLDETGNQGYRKQKVQGGRPRAVDRVPRLFSCPSGLLSFMVSMLFDQIN